MNGIADLNVVIAALSTRDALHDRVRAHLAQHGRLSVPLSVGLELLLGAHARRSRCVDAVMACDSAFDLESREVLLTAAAALDDRQVATVFDAVHLAEALHRGAPLHTADAELVRTRFPTVPV